MNWLPLLGILLVAYALFAAYIALKKPDKLWNIGKVRAFRKVLGEQGTTVFFLLFAAAMAGLGIWLMVK